jgi:hypothetical protein
MSILDDAIREHLELKRAHGADEAEVKKLEDEAFGPSGRPEDPDPLAEAPTEFMTAEPGEASGTVEPAEGRRINVADLQEPPEPRAPAAPQEVEVEAVEGTDEPEADAAPLAPAEDPAQAAPPAEEPIATEHDIVPEAATGPATEERHAIAEQPTEMFDVEAELGTEDAPPAEAPSPSDEEIVEVEAAEPKLAPVEPPTEIHAVRTAPAEELDDEEDDEFWSEQRLSDELDQALEAPITDEHEAPAATDEHAAPAPPTEEHATPPPAPETAAPLFDQEEGDDAREDDEPGTDYDPDTGHEDVLEDTPDFLEDAPEDDKLWFEQRPPKDFNFDD